MQRRRKWGILVRPFYKDEYGNTIFPATGDIKAYKQPQPANSPSPVYVDLFSTSGGTSAVCCEDEPYLYGFYFTSSSFAEVRFMLKHIYEDIPSQYVKVVEIIEGVDTLITPIT